MRVERVDLRTASVTTPGETKQVTTPPTGDGGDDDGDEYDDDDKKYE